MENDSQLNRLAMNAKAGCQSSLWSIRGHFIDFIHQLSDRYWNKIKSQDSFETRCFQRIDEAIRKFDPEKGGFGYQVTFRIYNLLKDQMCRYSRHMTKYSVSLYSLNSPRQDDEGETTELDIQDELALVDEMVIGTITTNEKIALLAEGDQRKLAILHAWSNDYNDSHAASFLAKRYGGNAESHRKFITRFRKACRGALA